MDERVTNRTRSIMKLHLVEDNTYLCKGKPNIDRLLTYKKKILNRFFIILMTADELAGHTNCRGRSSHKMLLCNPVKENLICYMLNMIGEIIISTGITFKYEKKSRVLKFFP